MKFSDPSAIVIPKKPPHKTASEHRKATKPIMEKRRRARINSSLEKIKSLILSALNKDPAKHSKLEKADILEMTVDYLKGINQIQSIDESTAIKSLKAGYEECASEVKRFVEIVPDMDLAMKRRLKSHINNNFTSLHITNPANNNNNNNFVSSTTSSLSSTGPSSPVLLSPTVDRDALTNNVIHVTKCEPDLQTPPPSANSHDSRAFSFSPIPFNHPNLKQLHHQTQQFNLSTTTIDDGMDCIPVDFSKSFKLHSKNVWRPW